MSGEGPRRRRRRWSLVLAPVVVAATALLPASASANVPFQQIQSPGPISDIYLGNELSCQVKLTQDQVFSYYPPNVAPGDCGTFLNVQGDPSVYGPDFGNHDGTATGGLGGVPVPWTPVSQTGVGGSGTTAEPYEVTTTVDGPTGIRVAERYTYVTGSRGYDVNITVTNSGGTSETVHVYHAIDCFLAGSDVGYGFFDSATGGIFCTETPNNSPPGRMLGFTPTAGTANYIEDFYSTVWEETDGSPYPNTAEPDVQQDNGLGLQWTLNVPAGRSTRAAETIGFRGTVDSGDVLETAILSGPKKKVKSKKKKKKATFTFSASLGGVPLTDATFSCTVDNRPPVPCTSPFTTKVKKGKHTFNVQATAAGETDTTPAALSWKLKRKKKK